MLGKRSAGIYALISGALALALISISPGAQAHTVSHPRAGGGVSTVKILDLTTYQNMDDYSRPVGTCTGTPGTVCSFTKLRSITTSIDAALNVSKSVVAGHLGFSLSATNVTSVSCSHVVHANQEYVAYAQGTLKQYKLRVTSPEGSQTSGWLQSWQPYTYPAIDCVIENI
jgi:hypothetical protein